jgi:uncharacterized membrane protein YbhN (UPF0104 family)
MRHLALVAARVVFLLLCGFFAWRIFDGRWSELGPALERMSYWVGVSALLTVVGLLVTSWLWTRILASYGHPLPWSRAASVFFTGQVGKYLPGSVWSIGAQARLIRNMGAPAPSIVGTGLVFLTLHVASGVWLGGLALVLSGSSPVPGAVAAGLAAVGAVFFHPRILGWLSRLLSGLRAESLTTWSDSARYGLAMTATWGAYTAGLLVLMRDHSWSHFWMLVAAVTLSYAAGVAVVVAPAGLGAREAVFVALMAPALGLTQATALALMARLVHTVADFLLAIMGARSLQVAGRGAPRGSRWT